VRQHMSRSAHRAALRRTLPKDALDGRIAEVLDAVGLSALASRSASELAHGQKQWLEIGMVLASNPAVLMLDEPVAGLTDEETERTASLVRGLKRPDRAIVVVEHDMDFVERIADRVTVLHEGKTLFEGSMANAKGRRARHRCVSGTIIMRFRVESLDQHYGSAQVCARSASRSCQANAWLCLAAMAPARPRS